MNQNKLIIRQLDEKLRKLPGLGSVIMPGKGWLNAVRTTLKMSLRQFGQKLGIKPSSANEIEMREVDGSITLKSLREAADVLGMNVIYYLVPKYGSIDMFIEKRANEIATEIVMRTSQSMKLEDQENSAERIQQSIKELTEEMTWSIPKSLWD